MSEPIEGAETPKVYAVNGWLFVVAASEEEASEFYLREYATAGTDPPSVEDGSREGYYSNPSDAEDELEPDCTTFEAMHQRLAEGQVPPFELARCCDF